jgi:hypothetical protein
MKIAVLIAGLILITKISISQTNLDSLICKYLVEKNEIEKPVNKTVKLKEGKYSKSSNYFYEKKPLIRITTGITIQPIIFGCYKSHSRKYLLLQFDTNSESKFYIYGEKRLFNEIDKLKAHLAESVNTQLTDEAIASLVNYLLLCYL